MSENSHRQWLVPPPRLGPGGNGADVAEHGRRLGQRPLLDVVDESHGVHVQVVLGECLRDQAQRRPSKLRSSRQRRLGEQLNGSETEMRKVSCLQQLVFVDRARAEDVVADELRGAPEEREEAVVVQPPHLKDLWGGGSSEREVLMWRGMGRGVAAGRGAAPRATRRARASTSSEASASGGRTRRKRASPAPAVGGSTRQKHLLSLRSRTRTSRVCEQRPCAA